MNHKNPFLESMRGGVESDYAHGDPQLSFAFFPAGEAASCLQADTVYYSASTVKVGVLVAVLREIAAGNLRFDQQLTVTHTFESVVPEAGSFVMEEEETDPGMGEVGSVCTLEHALTRMITVSANCATNMLFALVGPEKIQRAFSDAGAPECAMRRPYSDAAGLAAGVTNSASASGLAKFWLSLGEGKLLPPALTEYALQLCARVAEPVLADAIRAAAARCGVAEEQLLIASKPGSVTGIEHDAVFVRWGEKRVSLAVCTSGMTEAEAHEAMRATADALFWRWAGGKVQPEAVERNEGGVAVRFALLKQRGLSLENTWKCKLIAGRGEQTGCYAASTVKLAVAGAVLRAAEDGVLQLDGAGEVPSRRVFFSRVPGAPMFSVPADDSDPGLLRTGEPISVRNLLWRMLALSSNEATNILVEELGAAKLGAGSPWSADESQIDLEYGRNCVLRGLETVQELLSECVKRGFTAVGSVELSRPYCDSAANAAGFTHYATPLGLAELLWALLRGRTLERTDRVLLESSLWQQHFRMAIADEKTALKLHLAAKSGWDVGVLHEVIFLPGSWSSKDRVLALMTEGMGVGSARAALQGIAAALLL